MFILALYPINYATFPIINLKTYNNRGTLLCNHWSLKWSQSKNN